MAEAADGNHKEVWTTESDNNGNETRMCPVTLVCRKRELDSSGINGFIVCRRNFHCLGEWEKQSTGQNGGA